MTYAIISASGSQHKVSQGDELLLPKLAQAEKQKISFAEVLLISTDDKVMLGTPLVKDASVEAEIVAHLKGKKIRVATYKAKSRYRRVKGHRDHLTRVKILRIVTRENKSPTKSKPENSEQKTVSRKSTMHKRKK